MNKHLLPVYDEPMIFKSLASLQRMGVKDVMIVLGGHSGNSFFHLLGDGHRFGISITYAYQEKAGGIAEAFYDGVPEHIQSKVEKLLAPELQEVTEAFCAKYR